MKLYLVQHGEACAKEVDAERPLTDQGKRDIDRLAAFLKQAGIQVSRVIHSGKLRAKKRDPTGPAVCTKLLTTNRRMACSRALNSRGGPA